jgi:hypothetical protein
MCDIAEVYGGLAELRLEFAVGALLKPQRILDLVYDLIGTLQLLQRVLVRELLPTDLLPQLLDFIDVSLEVAAHSPLQHE